MEKTVRNQALSIAKLQEQVDKQARYWQAIGEPVRKKHDTGYFQDRGKLLAQIVELFSMDELTAVCFEIGVFWDTLAGDTLQYKTRSLIESLEREGQLYKLLDECGRQRPEAEWPML